MEKIESYKEEYGTLVGELKNSYYELQEAARDISNNREDVYFDEEEQKEIEERWDLIHSLKRKYGNTIEEILNYEKEKSVEIEQIENLDEYILELKNKQSKIEKDMKKIALELHKIREKYANVLSEQINKELQDLEMKNAKFSVEFEDFEGSVFTNAHNEWLTTLVNMGLLGVAAYAAVFITALQTYRKNFLAVLLLLTYGIHSLISFQQVLNAPLFFLILGLCEAAARGEKTKTNQMDTDEELLEAI